MVELIYFKHRLVLGCLSLLRCLRCERVWGPEALQKGLGCQREDEEEQGARLSGRALPDSLSEELGCGSVMEPLPRISLCLCQLYWCCEETPEPKQLLRENL